MKLLLFFLVSATCLASEDNAKSLETRPRGTPEMQRKAHIAHGIVISLAAVLLFPIGGILLRWFKPHLSPFASIGSGS